MEFVGNENKIRALFCELKLEDERVTPGFSKVCSIPRTPSPGSRHALTVSFATAAALVVLALCVFTLWPRNLHQGPSLNPTAAVISTWPDDSLPISPKREADDRFLDAGRDWIRFHGRTRKLAARRQAGRAAIREAAAIAGWRSPTATLMESPADDLLISVPQLAQSIAELKSFLPDETR